LIFVERVFEFPFNNVELVGVGELVVVAAVIVGEIFCDSVEVLVDVVGVVDGVDVGVVDGVDIGVVDGVVVVVGEILGVCSGAIIC